MKDTPLLTTSPGSLPRLNIINKSIISAYSTWEFSKFRLYISRKNFNFENNFFRLLWPSWALISILTELSLGVNQVILFLISNRASIKAGTWNISQHSGTFRNMPEHPGTSRNIPEHEKIKVIFMKKNWLNKMIIIT